MRIPVHSPWLPGHIDVAQTVPVLLTTAGLSPDRPRMSRRKALLSIPHYQPGLSPQHLQHNCRRGLLTAILTPSTESPPSGPRDPVKCKLDPIAALLKALRGSHLLQEKPKSFQGPSKSQDLHLLHHLSDLTSSHSIQLHWPPWDRAVPGTVSSQRPQGLCIGRSLCPKCSLLGSQQSFLAHLLQNIALLSPQ